MFSTHNEGSVSVRFLSKYSEVTVIFLSYTWGIELKLIDLQEKYILMKVRCMWDERTVDRENSNEFYRSSNEQSIHYIIAKCFFL